MEQLEKVQKLPLSLPSRVIKTICNSTLLDFETEELNRLGKEVGEKMGNLIPAPLAYRS
jgi:hypothetical protein